MSYTVSKTIKVEYTDHVAVLEQNGNTYKAVEKPVTKYKDVVVNVNVNTTPFDTSVDKSARNIGYLTDSVIGFKTANVASKQENEQAIVGHVTSGFMNMIEKNINLQNAGIDAEMHALASELSQQCKELVHKHDVMSKDFNRIKSRYTGLFETINKEFSNRMHALIKPCFEFVSQVKKEQNRRVDSTLLSVATVCGQESDSARIAIQASKMKQNAESLINASKNYIDANRSLKRTVLAFSMADGEGTMYYAPVIIMAGSTDKTGQEDVHVFANPMIYTDGKVEEAIRLRYNEIKDSAISSEFQNRISEYFYQKLGELNDGTIHTRRIVEQMEKLFKNNEMRTFL